MIEKLDINGDPPDLTGQILDEILVQSFWFENQLEEEANVIFIKVEGCWYRLYFDSGIIFWRSGSDQPKSSKFQNDDGTWSEFSIINLGLDRGLIGKKIQDYVMSSIEGGSSVVFQLEGGLTFGFQCIGDNSKIIAQAPCTGRANSA